MKLTKEEEDQVTVWRLVKRVCVKFGESYYSVDITPKKIAMHYYTPDRAHCNFSTPKETIANLRRVLKMTVFEYKYDIPKMREKIRELEGNLESDSEELAVLKKEYNSATKQAVKK